MKLLNINVDRLEELFEIIDQCKGKVALVGDDSRLNL